MLGSGFFHFSSGFGSLAWRSVGALAQRHVVQNGYRPGALSGLQLNGTRATRFERIRTDSSRSACATLPPSTTQPEWCWRPAVTSPGGVCWNWPVLAARAWKRKVTCPSDSRPMQHIATWSDTQVRAIQSADCGQQPQRFTPGGIPSKSKARFAQSKQTP